MDVGGYGGGKTVAKQRCGRYRPYAGKPGFAEKLGIFSEKQEEIRYGRGTCKRYKVYLRTGKFFFYPVNLLLCVCLLYTSPSPRDRTRSRMPSSA